MAWQYQSCAQFIVTTGILLYFNCQIQVKRNAVCNHLVKTFFCFAHPTSFYFSSQSLSHFIHTEFVREITTHAYTDLVHNNCWSMIKNDLSSFFYFFPSYLCKTDDKRNFDCSCEDRRFEHLVLPRKIFSLHLSL